MADEATLRARLAAAEDAIHNLLMGEAVVEVEYEGHRTKFKASDETKLRRYIHSLKRQLGEATPAMSRRVLF